MSELQLNFKNAIELKDVTKRYDGFTLDKICMAVPKGSIMGFIGQNGAGKTTTIRSILNIVEPDEGSIHIFGMDNREKEQDIKQHISAVFDEIPFHDVLTAKNINDILCEIFHEWDAGTYYDYLDRFQLPRKKKIGQFSKGMKMKLQIAAALSHKARLLIMDEATTGLDPIVRNEMLDIFMEYLQDENNSILMSSHITGDLDKVADSITFIDKGKILLTGYKDDILDSHAIMKCSKSNFQEFDAKDYVSARISDFGVDILVNDRNAVSRKYGGVVLEPVSLEDIMIFYVNREKKGWRS